MLNIIKEKCFLNKNKLFYSHKNEKLTYGEWWKAANDLSSKIPNGYNEPIIVYGNKEKKVLIAFLACLLSGNAYISINDTIPENRIKKIIEDSKSKYIINCTRKKINYLKDINSLERKKVKFSNNENDPAYIIFTSGTTGNPKGVLIKKKNLHNFVKWINCIIPKGENLKILNQANYSFDLSVCDLYFTISNSYTLVAYDNNFFESYDIIKNNEINVLVITPTFAKIFLMDNRFNEKNLPNLKTIFFCGEKLEKSIVIKLFKKFKNINIINAYGPTEATCAVSAIKIEKRHLNYKCLPVGNMNCNACNIEIINDEIVIKGKSVFDGYINLVSSNCYVENNINCYKTGDIGYIKDNLLFCTGRIDNQIKYKGYRIEIEDIEENINLIDGVNDSIVAPIMDDDGNIKFIKATVFLNKNISINYIKSCLKKSLPDYMIPKIIDIKNEILINDNCKKERRIRNEF